MSEPPVPPSSSGNWPPPPPPSARYGPPPPPLPSSSQVPTPDKSYAGLKKLLTSAGVIGLLLLKFGGKLKFLILPVLKFAPAVLKTGGTMIFSIGAYAMMWGWWFAAGFVLLIFVHECGHLVAARTLGLRVGAPVFIPFMGAFIALKDAPKDAWTEAWVGIGGPLLGTLGSVICEGIYLLSGNELFRALAYTGFFLNLFNLAPIGFLDGGRIVSALSPWLWLIGAVVMGYMFYHRPNFIILLILLMSLPRLWSLFRQRTEAEQRYYEVSPTRRFAMAGLYFGLIAFLVFGMQLTHVAVQR